MNIADELNKAKDRIETVIAWVKGSQPKADQPAETKFVNRRLKLFMDQYQARFGTLYDIRDPIREGGAAKRTETKANDVDYLDAVRAYLADPAEAFGAPFFKFEKRIDFWLNQVRGKKE